MNPTTHWLERAALWRAASLLFRPPTPDLRGELAALCSELPEGQRDVARRFAATPVDAWSGEYHRVLGPGGCPASESTYDRSALAGRGPLLAGVAGYYRAFAYEPAADAAEVPDHLAVELGFLGYLAFKAAFAAHAERAAELEVACRAYDQFLEEHPAFWIGRLTERLAESESSLYLAAARWVEALCGAGRAGMQPIELLMAEHRLIEEALAALEAFVRRLTAGPEVRLRLREFAAFFKNFADRRHHGKEEDRLFRSLARHGFPLDGGPLAVMLAEHEEGRGHVRALARIAAGDGPLGPEERDEVEREARRFAVLLRNHIQKEDRILYPMALRVLPAEELDDLARQFAELEDSASPGVGLEGFRSAARALAEAHPPGAAR